MYAPSLTPYTPCPKNNVRPLDASATLPPCVWLSQVMLDVAGSTLAAVIEEVLSALVECGHLDPSKHPLASAALAGAINPLTLGRNRKTLDRKTKSLDVVVSGSESRATDGDGSFKMLEPDQDEEALDLLLAHVAFVDQPVMAFARLAAPIDAGMRASARGRVQGPRHRGVHRRNARSVCTTSARMISLSYSLNHSPLPLSPVASISL